MAVGRSVPCSVLLLALIGCPASRLPCQRDADCGDGICVDDLDRGDRYCSQTCSGDADCPVSQRCELRVAGGGGDTTSVQLCVERVRACSASERCNGLDDNCNGAVDEGCSVLACTSDAICGGYWPCQPALTDTDDFVCQAPVADGARPGEPCSAGSDCYNGLCEIGICAAVCRSDDDCSNGDRCAEPSSPGDMRPHNSCHRACDQFTPCASGEACALRADPFGCRWRAVCSPERGALTWGNSCQAHDDCASALCAAGHCTRPCVDNQDCSGLWSNAQCGIVATNPDPLLCGIVEIQVCR